MGVFLCLKINMNLLASIAGGYTKGDAMSNPQNEMQPNNETINPIVITPVSEMDEVQLLSVLPSRGYANCTPTNREAYERWLTLKGASESQINALSDTQVTDIYDDRKDFMLRSMLKMRASDIRSKPATLDGIQINRVRDAVKADEMASAMSDSIVRAMVMVNTKQVTLDDVRKIVREELPLRQSSSGKPRSIVIKRDDHEPVTIEGVVHKEFAHVLKMATRDNVMMVGGAGSGKTTLARQVAKALALPFYFTGAVPHEAKLLGFINPHGKYVETAFYRAWTTGGIFLMDEIDASDPQALLAINAALDNGICDFPCGMVEKHKDFHFIGAANTFGKGATMEFIGRNAQDEAGRSRWYYIQIDYDEAMEETIALSFASADIAYGWCKYIRCVRKAVADLCERHVVSPRSTIKGAKALQAGITRDKVENAVLWHGMDDERKRRVLEKAKEICGGELP